MGTAGGGVEGEPQESDDIEVGHILSRIDDDLINRPEVVKPIDPALYQRLVELTDGIEVDLDLPLAPGDV